MNTRQKLEVIRRMLGLTQAKLAERLGVSFTAFNGWWTGKSAPRPRMQAAIDALFLEVTGGKLIPDTVLTAKKQALEQRSSRHRNVADEILSAPDIRDQFVLQLTYHSNRIEGSTLDERDTAAVLFDNVALPNKSLTEQLEAKNHQAALLYLFGHISQKGGVTGDMVMKLHGMLMNGVRSDAGRYRTHAVRIVGVHLPTANHASIPVLMRKVMKEAAGKTNDIIALSAKVHSSFEQIHPFSDGNGRVGRLLMAAMLLRHNFAPAIIRQQHKQLYYTYLYKAQTKGDPTQLEDFLCEAIADGFDVLERKDLK